MALQQCLACNRLTTELSRACVCGHVFEEASRFISGKRFSEYRAKLYSRLETKIMKRKAAEDGPKGSNCTPASYPFSNPMNLNAAHKRSAQRKNSDKSKRRKRYRSMTLKQRQNTGKILSAELLISAACDTKRKQLERPSPDREQEIAEIVLNRSKRSKNPVNPNWCKT